MPLCKRCDGWIGTLEATDTRHICHCVNINIICSSEEAKEIEKLLKIVIERGDNSTIPQIETNNRD